METTCFHVKFHACQSCSRPYSKVNKPPSFPRLLDSSAQRDTLDAEANISGFSKPFVLRVHTDSFEGTPDQDTDFSNRGFCLDFVQQPCTSVFG